MTRVLYVAADPALVLEQPGGAGTHMRGTLAGLEAAGLEVERLIGAPASLASSPTVAQKAAPRLRRVSPRLVRLVARDLRLLAHARACRRAPVGLFDCVYERSAYLVDVGRPLAVGRGVPYLVETDGILVGAVAAAGGAAFRRAAERLERRKIAVADTVVTMSRASAEAIRVSHALPPERLLVKGLGVERCLVDAPPRVEERYDIGFAGTFQPYHGLELLLEALRLLPGSTALLVGDGPRRDAVAAAAAGIQVDLPGLLPHRETLDRLAACRVLVVPESSETLYPVKALEYAALRKPVVVPRRAAFGEFVAEGETLLHTFAPGDAADLARAIAAALGGGAAGKVERLAALVAAEYTWEAVGARVASRVEELVVR